MSSWRKHVTDDTKSMIDILISKKQLINTLASKQGFYSKIATWLTLLLIVYALIHFRSQPEENILFTTAAFLTNLFHLAWLILVTGLHLIHIHSLNVLDKEKASLENLRLETVDHLKNTWYINQHSEVRDAISADLEESGINVRNKST